MSGQGSMGNRKSKRQENSDCHSSTSQARENDQQQIVREEQSDSFTSHGSHQQANAHDQNASLPMNSLPFDATATKTAQCNRLKSPLGNNRNKSRGIQLKRDLPSNRNPHKTAKDAVIDSTRAQVNNLLEGIGEFQGTSQDDKNYRYFDEMLTRCMLNLDQIECKDSRDRTIRKEAIRGVNEAISILDRKLKINLEIKELEKDFQQDS